MALAYDPVMPDIAPLPMEVLGGAESPKLVIQRLKAIDNLDGGDFLSPDRADFYAIVLVNDVEYKTRIMAMDDGRPGWEIPLPRLEDKARIKIRIFDEDGGLEGGDDHVDISRAKDKKDLVFTYFPQTGMISGDVNGRKGQGFYTRGWNDGDKAHMWFAIV